MNLIPYLNNANSDAPHSQLFWRNKNDMSVREGMLKLVRIAGGKTDELYDLATDIGEQRDLASSRPGDTARLAAALQAWDREMVLPAFPGAGPKRK